MEETKKKQMHPADTNGDGKVSKEEHKMYLEFKRKELDDQDAMRDAQRRMAWFVYVWYATLSLCSCTCLIGLDQGIILGDMAATYFVSVAAIVAAFFGTQAYSKNKQ